MIFSKSFGYAVRGVLYIALMQDGRQFVQAEEIAEKLAVPRHFMSKILKRLVKAGILSSSKGKSGGFAIHELTAATELMTLFHLTDGQDAFLRCSLRLQVCSAANPCPLHNQMDDVKQQLRNVLLTTTIGDLLKGDKEDFIKQIATTHERI